MSLKDEFIHTAKFLTPRVRIKASMASLPQELYYKHHIFPVKLFSLLLNTLQAKPDHDARNIKFVTTSQKKLLLAQAGAHGAYVPSCKQMVSSVMRSSALSAGLIYLNPQRLVIGISNENDSFELSVKSLLWPLAIMHLMNIPIDPNLSIIGKNEAPFELTPNDREQIIENLPLQTLQSMLHANRSPRVIIRESVCTRHHLFTSNQDHRFPIEDALSTEFFDKLRCVEY
jgi:hypothetical protein